MTDDDAPAVQAHLVKARQVWARISAVLKGKNASPKVCGVFYCSVIQSMLLYGRKSWVLNPDVLTRLEGFHIRAAWRMAKEHRLRRRAQRIWTYPRSAYVLEEVGLQRVEEYIRRRQNHVSKFIATRPLFAICWEGKWLRGSPLTLVLVGAGV